MGLPNWSEIYAKTPLRTRRILTAIVLFLASQFFFLVNIQFPRTHNFDEFHYVPTAQQFLKMDVNRNWEHPPLAKMLMAVGIGIFGDQPLGWRFMSTVFGALTLVGMYFLGLIIFKTEEAALWITFVTLFNQLLFVQARIAMLDTFMMGFLTWAMVTFTASWSAGGNGEPSSPARAQTQRRLFLATGVLLGLATACKWFALVPWASWIGLILCVRLMQKWKLRFEYPQNGDWYHSRLWQDIRGSDLLLYLGVVPLGVYFLCCLPMLFFSMGHSGGHSGFLAGVLELWNMQVRMWDGQLRVVNSHPYMSQWPGWALMVRPIWYAFNREDFNSVVRGVILLGNPLVMWGGLIALGWGVWEWIERRQWRAFVILYFYTIFYLSWIALPRKISFYYYYYPAGMMLSLALALVFFRTPDGSRTSLLLTRFYWVKWVFLALVFGLFVYFFPILAAFPIPADSFRKWMWFASWI